jgi:hypothetical protein
MVNALNLALQLTIGMCVRHVQHRGLPVRYGHTVKIIYIGEKEVVGKVLLSSGVYDDDDLIFSKKWFDDGYEAVDCPNESNR